MREEIDIEDIRDLRPPYLHKFNQFLLHEIAKSYGKSPSDLKATIAELRRKAEKVPPPKRGLEAGTRARHYTFLRHAFNDELKQKGVTVEMRADMMGHGGKTETSERYANAFQLTLQAEDMLHIPVLTSAIPAHQIRIVPWVKALQGAPWSRPSRKPKGE